MPETQTKEETETKEVVETPEEDSPPKAPEKAEESTASKAKELANVLDSYFEHDMNLRQTYRQDVPVEDLRQLRMVQAMKPEADILLEAVQICKKLKLNEEKTKVRAVLVQGRTTLILRDLPRDVQYEHIKKLLESEELVSQLDSKVKEIRPELNETWFVRFSSQDDCLKAAEWLTFHGKIKGQRVRCRVKSVLPSTYSPNPTGQYPQTSPNFGSQSFNQFTGQFVNGQQNPNVFGPYGMPQMSPNGMPFSGMPPSPLFGAAMNGMNNYNQGRRNSGRNDNQGRRNSGRNDRGNNRRGSYRGRPDSNRQQSGGYKRQKSSRGQKSQPPQAAAAVTDPDYQSAFKLIERTNFHEVTRNALANDEDEPKMPDELKAFPALQAKKPKIHFDQDPSPSSQAISPMPVPETSGAETPPKLNLNTKPNKGKGRKGSKTKTFSKTPLRTSEENDDVKEESPVKAQTAI